MIKKQYTIVTTAEQLAELKSHINSWDFFAFDTETTGLNVRKDKVIGLSVCGKAGVAFYLPRLTWNKTFHCLKQVISDNDFHEIILMLAKKDLLMWNASFDIRIVKNDLKVDLTEALLADIMLMKHTVEEEGNFGLKDVAIQYQNEIGLGGLEIAANEEQIALKANVIANGGTWLKSNKEMYKADLEVMGLYACADADLTFRLAELFRDKLEAEGLEKFYYDKEVMPLYKYVTIPMEENGICLDLALIRATLADLVVDMNKLESSILTQLNTIPAVKKWKNEKALENYSPKTTGQFAQAFADYFELPLPQNEAGKYSFAKKNIENLTPSPAKNFLLLDKLSPMFSTPLGQALMEVDVELPSFKQFEEISQKLFIQNGEDKINISSKQQMGQIVFDCLKVKPLSTTPKGSPQFDDDMIQHLVDVEKIAWARDLSNYNKLVKIKGTYIDRFLDAEEGGKYYFTYKQHGTISGRFSGDAQQLPRPKEAGEMDEVVLKYNNVIRSFFICGEGRAFIDDDYESLEPHVFAHVSGDEGLRDIFRMGHDFYSTIAIRTEKLQNVSADKKAPNYLGRINKPKRQASKEYSLGIPYGKTPYALGKSLNCPTKEAEILYNGYLDGFPKLKYWMEDSKRQAQLNGFVKSEAGRIRHLPKVPSLYKKHGDQLLNYMYVKGLEKKFGKEVVKFWVMDYKNGINNSRNFQIQSLGASIVNHASIAISKKLKELKIDAWIAFNCHDQIIINCPLQKAEECAKIVQDIMENSYPLSLKLKAPAVIGTNFKDAH